MLAEDAIKAAVKDYQTKLANEGLLIIFAYKRASARANEGALKESSSNLCSLGLPS
ncbi:hypothetical protein RchiOBHm_Chr3g0471841 [Rosa chinensis]|uniref:Uncharacterized protein n=1 Tax=Rosa chinensis TaxID=74649 RepID=A0A2P6RBE7_ROSCH|nr:hypothetical protein RchiOBHm_Chr3g0471841 [Rosa chinensis]